MQGKLKLLVAIAIAGTPFNIIRRAMYNAIFSYKIDSTAKIGFGTVIAVTNFSVGKGTVIGPFNIFKGPIDVSIGQNTKIGRLNQFFSSWHIMNKKFESRGYKPILRVGNSCLVMNQHIFDVYGEVVIGEGTWIAGYGSQFWTHGLSVTDRDIIIGNRNYIGSATRFSPGVRIGDDNIIALGSVLFSKTPTNGGLISGFPAKTIRSIEDERKSGKYKFTFEDWS